MAEPSVEGPGPATEPLCFVLMPFGAEDHPTGIAVDFDAVYHELLAPAIRDAGLTPLRADEEVGGGIIHKPMFERLILCEYAVVDLTLADPRTFYGLGIRHAVRPYSTVLVFASGTRLPFDVAGDRGLPYLLTPSGTPEDVDATRELLAGKLSAARDASTDSPVFQLVDGYPDIDRLKTDAFREQAGYSEEWKERLASDRRKGVEALRRAELELGPLPDVESGVVIDLFLSYRAVEAWEEMVSLAGRMPRPLAATTMVREQLGLALNRLERRDEAERVLLDLIAQRGPSSETYGILGRVYKDEWQEAVGRGEDLLARGLLDKAMDAYLKGFEADWRDAYPGINAVTLMEVREPPDPRREDLSCVVSYAVDRRIASGRADYWDHATQLELAVLAKDEARASDALSDALAAVRESWEPRSTASNLRLIRKARTKRGEAVAWAEAIEDALEQRGAAMEGRRPQ